MSSTRMMLGHVFFFLDAFYLSDGNIFSVSKLHTQLQEINQFMSGHPANSLGVLFTLTKEACEVCHELTQDRQTRLSDFSIEMMMINLLARGR